MKIVHNIAVLNHNGISKKMSTIAAMKKRQWKPEAYLITELDSGKYTLEFCFDTIDGASPLPVEQWSLELIETARGDVKYYKTIDSAVSEVRRYNQKVKNYSNDVIIQIIGHTV